MKDVHITEQSFFGENVISFEEHVNALILCPLSDAEHQGWKRISLDEAQKLANRVGHNLTIGDDIIYWFKTLEPIGIGDEIRNATKEILKTEKKLKLIERILG